MRVPDRAWLGERRLQVSTIGRVVVEVVGTPALGLSELYTEGRPDLIYHSYG